MEVRTTENEEDAVRALAQILSSKEGRAFVLGLKPIDGVLCIELLDHVRSNPPSTTQDTNSLFQIQALADHNLRSSEKQVFLGSLRKLAGAHGRLPDSMVITDKVEFLNSGQCHTSGGFADIKQGRYKGCTVAVKNMRVSELDDFDKIRKVRTTFLRSRDGLIPFSRVSVRKLLFGSRYHTPMSWGLWGYWMVSRVVSLPRFRNGWHTATSWNTLGRTRQTGSGS
jgi:hypothetical protein